MSKKQQVDGLEVKIPQPSNPKQKKEEVNSTSSKLSTINEFTPTNQSSSSASAMPAPTPVSTPASSYLSQPTPSSKQEISGSLMNGNVNGYKIQNNLLPPPLDDNTSGNSRATMIIDGKEVNTKNLTLQPNNDSMITAFGPTPQPTPVDNKPTLVDGFTSNITMPSLPTTPHNFNSISSLNNQYSGFSDFNAYIGLDVSNRTTSEAVLRNDDSQQSLLDNSSLQTVQRQSLINNLSLPPSQFGNSSNQEEKDDLSQDRQIQPKNLKNDDSEMLEESEEEQSSQDDEDDGTHFSPDYDKFLHEEDKKFKDEDDRISDDDDDDEELYTSQQPQQSLKNNGVMITQADATPMQDYLSNESYTENSPPTLDRQFQVTVQKGKEVPTNYTVKFNKSTTVYFNPQNGMIQASDAKQQTHYNDHKLPVVMLNSEITQGPFNQEALVQTLNDNPSPSVDNKIHQNLGGKAGNARLQPTQYNETKNLTAKQKFHELTVDDIIGNSTTYASSTVDYPEPVNNLEYDNGNKKTESRLFDSVISTVSTQDEEVNKIVPNSAKMMNLMVGDPKQVHNDAEVNVIGGDDNGISDALQNMDNIHHCGCCEIM